MKQITFWFAVTSPYAYLAFERLPQVLVGLECSIHYRPVLFAGLLNAHGQKGPAEIPAKAWWMAKDLLRKAARLGVPLRPPASHPFNPLLSLWASLVPQDGAQ